MKIVCCFSALLLLSAGVLGANKKAGEACTSDDICETIGSYCDASGSCACNVGFVLAGNTCARVHGQVCDSSMCSSSEMICKESKCACDTNAHLKATTSGTSCTCDDGYTRNSAGKCVQKLDTDCKAGTECVDNAKCTGTGTQQCKCDTGYAPSGVTACVLDCDAATEVKEDNVCKKKSEADCSSGTCVNNANCVTANSASTCVCDDEKNYAADSTGKCVLSCDAATEVEEDNVCKKKSGEDCSSGTCVNNANCVTENSASTCVCDADKHYAGDAVTGKCVCDTTGAIAYTLRDSDKTCVQKLDTACSTGSEQCVDNAKCADDNGTQKCKCNAGYAPSGLTACVLDCDAATEVEVDNMCKKKAGQSCTAGTDTCIDGTTCTGGKCKCDDSANQEADSNTGTCKCKDKYTFNSDRVCAKDIDEACTNTESSVPCIDGAICDKKTKKCVCDAANNFQASGNSACICMSDFTPSGNRCLAPVGEPCVAKDAANVCVSGASCVDNATTTTVVDYSCTCTNKANYDGTCGGAVGVVASLITMMSSVIVASYLM